MRAVLSVDLICAARAIVNVPRARQAAAAKALIQQAQKAEAYGRDCAAAHPLFGDGTLAGAARKSDMAEERTICDPAFSSALILILQTIQRHVELDRTRN